MRSVSMEVIYKIPLTLASQPEGGYVVTSSALPELVTEGDTIDEAIEHVRDVLAAVVELYEDLGKSLPVGLRQGNGSDSIEFEHLVSRA
jgi:antitoxin HicB